MPMRPPQFRPSWIGPRIQPARPNASERGYGGAWRKRRAAFLAAHPVCCTPGCRARATHADHIRLRRDGGSDDAANLRPLCHPCHSRITASADGGFGNPTRDDRGLPPRRAG